MYDRLWGLKDLLERKITVVDFADKEIVDYWEYIAAA
jgi:hypothetical protein